MTAKIGKTVGESQPYWPDAPGRPFGINKQGAPNILVVLFDDVGFSDFGCYGSPIATPTIDAIARRGLRYTGFHTTAMCSTTRAALLTGRNHHSVGVGCLANFDSGYPGYRGKIAREAGTIAEMLRPHGYRNYMLGKWHVTPLTESGATGPVDGWPLGRGFDRFYGFMDAETDQYAPELVRDNTSVDPPGSFATGYHLTADLVDQAIRYLADHVADDAEVPWLAWLALGACHAPHQAPFDLIGKYDALFAEGWDAERDRRLARQKETGIVPKDTRLPVRNDMVKAWAEIPEGERRLYTRLQAAYAAMLDHADQHLARLVTFLEQAGQLDDTMIIVLSDNGASQEGGPFGMVNAMGPFNLRREPLEEKIARIDDIGGPDTHSNFPLGWAMAANTPLRRYKQNTHGGGIRDALVISWPKGIVARDELRHQFCHACDLAPTLLDVVGVKAPATINGVKQMPLEGTSFAVSLNDPKAPSKSAPQYFEMFGHRGLVQDGWKAVSFHPMGTSFDQDKWELFHLDRDFSETDDLAEKEPERLKAMIAEWWKQAEAHQVLPLDDRFVPRFADNAKRFHGPRKRFVFHAGMGHVPTDVAPDVRSRSYTIEADARIDGAATEGVLIAHGDMTCGYSLYIKDNRLTYDMNVGGVHHIAVSDRPVPRGNRRLGLRMRRDKGHNIATLLIDGEPAGGLTTQLGFISYVSWSGLDIGRNRGSPVSHYEAPFAFTGKLRKVTVLMDDDQALDAKAAAAAVLARANDAPRMTSVQQRAGVDSPYAWRLAFVSMFCIGLGGGAIYLPVVALKEIAAEFGDRRAVPSMAYMLGFFAIGLGGVFMGWLADRTSPRVPLLIAGVSIFVGGWLATSGGQLALFAGYALPLGFLGNAATFTPAMNNIQSWFDKRRSTAVSVISVGPAISGFVWPQVYRWLLPDMGWRRTLVIYGITAGVLLFLCAFYVRPSPIQRARTARPPEDLSILPMSSRSIMVLLSLAGFCCCAAMAMPFVHMVAFCGDLGLAPARGSEAISLILLTAVAATFAMGRLADYIGPLRVSLLCALIQIASLLGFVFVESLAGIYTLSVVHGIPYIAIVQGYALILRQLYGPAIAGWRLGVVMLFAMGGMAVGGWMGGAIFDATLSYRPAFQLALAFNLLNVMLLGALYFWQRPRNPAIVLP